MSTRSALQLPDPDAVGAVGGSCRCAASAWRAGRSTGTGRSRWCPSVSVRDHAAAVAGGELGVAGLGLRARRARRRPRRRRRSVDAGPGGATGPSGVEVGHGLVRVLRHRRSRAATRSPRPTVSSTWPLHGWLRERDRPAASGSAKVAGPWSSASAAADAERRRRGRPRPRRRAGRRDAPAQDTSLRRPQPTIIAAASAGFSAGRRGRKNAGIRHSPTSTVATTNTSPKARPM